MSRTAIIKLIESSKATVLVSVVAILGALVYLGKLDATQFLEAVKVLVPGWMLAHAGEQGAKALSVKGDRVHIVHDKEGLPVARTVVKPPRVEPAADSTGGE